MLKTILLSFVFCFLSVLSLVEAQLHSKCGPNADGRRCSPGFCCTTSGVCRIGSFYCKNCLHLYGDPCSGGTRLIAPPVGPTRPAPVGPTP
ncbi:MAG: hypothetical protein J3Q66DRAFT_322401, partial [Benniella sp.]